MTNHGRDRPHAEPNAKAAGEESKRVSKDLITAIEKIFAPLAGIMIAGGWYVIKYHSAASGAFLILGGVLLLLYIGYLYLRHNVFLAQRIDGWIASSVVSLILIFLILSAVSYAEWPNLPEETETHGWLVSANEPTPNNQCGQPSAGSIVFLLGTAAFVTKARSDIRVITIMDKASLSLERNESGLLLSGDIFNINGDLVARLEKNEFHLVPTQIAYEKRSADRSELAVVGKKGEILLYVHYINFRAIMVLGHFAVDKNRFIDITEEAISDQNHNTVRHMCIKTASGARGLVVDENGFGM